MKKIFALRGKSNTGKRQTLRTVVEMLNAKQPNATVEHNPETQVDPRVVMTVNHLQIGIESHGNKTGGLLKETLDSFVKVGCDIIICATRTRGTTIEAVDALSGYEVEWLQQREQSQPTEQILRNIVMARQIVERVELLSESAEPAVAKSLSATA